MKEKNYKIMMLCDECAEALMEEGRTIRQIASDGIEVDTCNNCGEEQYCELYIERLDKAEEKIEDCCPFCGAPVIIAEKDEGLYYAECVNCGDYPPPLYRTPRQAAEAWMEHAKAWRVLE